VGKNVTIEPVSGDLFKSLMRKIASSVAVITTCHDGHLHGMTATAVASVSADPPAILIVVNRSARSHALISASKAFNVNILSAHQSELSGRFASKQDDSFDGVAYSFGGNGAPILDGAVASIECRTALETDFGTHTIFIGHVVGGSICAGDPLIYQNGSYRSSSPRTAEREIA
jgi:flavin reductase (DIM6/NTAB) family NADH-FMN oxidoreductase RutF